MVEIEEVEGYASAALRLARMDGDDRPDARVLAKPHLGDVAPNERAVLEIGAEAAAGVLAERPGFARAYPLPDAPRRAAVVLEAA